MAKIVNSVQLGLKIPNGFDDKGTPKFRSVIVRQINPEYTDEAIVQLSEAINLVLTEQSVSNILTSKCEVY
ncbi:MAG: DUF1659 domain-containing protein [Culicoidibacterales bacterium]